MKNNLTNILGWYGVLAVFAAYALVSFSLTSPHALLYQALNFTGALGIAIETYYKKDYQPFWLNVVWLLVAFVAIISIVAH